MLRWWNTSLTRFISLAVLGTVCSVPAWAREFQLERGRNALQSFAGCYLVDYSYTESESLKEGYVRDARVYDVNRDKAVKEWIYTEEISPRQIRIQHVLFAADLQGKVSEESLLKHQAEDWEFDAPFLYDFTAPSNWNVKDLKASPGLWTRRITNLDDGLRYQCAASWQEDTAYPEWSCDNYAPIPGRETRDMGRKDYNTLQRSSRIIAYGKSWLERQENIKTIDANGIRTSLVKELGKNWYVRLPDSECTQARAFVNSRLAFWQLLRETWDKVLVGDRTFLEKSLTGQPPRFVKMMEIEEGYYRQDLSDPAVRNAAEQAILKVIGEYRAQ